MHYKAVVAYKGTHFSGWQVQVNGPTIQEAFMEAGKRFMHLPFTVTGASRTDAGVHAFGQTVCIRTEGSWEPFKLMKAFNAFLPDDIAIRECTAVDASFHPRFDAIRKTYHYDIQTGPVALPQLREWSLHIRKPLDLAAMRKAAAYLVGEHDFKSFCSVNTNVKDTVRTIEALEVSETESGIRLIVTGNGFLYNMIRIIAGTLIEVGFLRIPPEEVKEMLEACDRKAAGPTAPAHGLTLYAIEYPSEGQGEMAR